MPPRREPRSSSLRTDSTPRQARWPGWLRLSLPRLTPPTPQALGRAALVGLGALVGGGLLSLIWHEPDRAGVDSFEVTPGSLAEKPARAITVLVIGLDADKLGESPNKAAPAGPPNADALLLVRVNPKGPLQLLNLPTEVAVNLPGQSRPVALGSLYRLGGVALTADGVRELVGLEPPRPDRFLVVPRSALRTIVDAVGGLEISPPRVMRYQDKAQKYTIDLQSGLQRLDGRQVEQLARFRDPGYGDSGRRQGHQLVETSLRERLARPEQLLQLPGLLTTLQGQVETNLTGRESLSLLAAGLDDHRPIQFATLPLKPAQKENGGLRQLDLPPDRPVWRAP